MEIDTFGHEFSVDSQLFQTIVENISSAVFVLQGEQIRYVNAPALSITAYSKEELFAMPFRAVIHEDFQDMVKQRGRSRQAGGDVSDHYEAKIVRKDGEVRWVNFHTSMIGLGGQPAVLAIAEDIYEQKQSEEAFQTIINNIVEDSGKTYFDNVTSSLCEWLNADCAIISEIIAHEGRVETLGMQLDGEKVAEFGYNLPGSPCINAISKGYAVYPEHVREIFPHDKELDDIQAEGYVGVSLKGKGGEPVGILCVLSRRKLNLPTKTKDVLEIIATKTAAQIEYKREQDELRMRMQRLTSQRTAIMQLSTSTHQILEDFLQEACKVSANTQDVNRVSIWLLSENRRKLRCLNLFERRYARHESGAVLNSDDYPRYFAALAADRAVEAHDARSDSRTCEFTQEYLVPLGITSMLDVPIRMEGKVVGVLCHEHTEDARRWTDDEVGFACDVADQVAQALINEKRKQAEESLRDSRARLAEAQRIGKMGNWEFDIIHDTGFYSEESSRIFGVLADYGKSFKSFFRLVHPDDRWLVKQANQKAIESGGFSNVQYRIIRPDGCVRFVQTSGECHWDKSGRPCRIFGTIQDITERKQAELLIEQTAEVVEMVATGQPASSIYDAIALMYEARHPGMRCSMLELKGDKLMHGGAPSLPEAYCNAVHGLQNGPNIGSCGTSTYTGKRVLVEDIATDPKWAALKSVALPHGLRSCWSEPIKSAAGEVLGAFGMYYNHPALPDEQELTDLVSGARLACIVMEREQRGAAVRKLSSAIEQAGESILITDREGVIEYVNPAFTTLTGYSASEAIGQTPRLLNSGNQDGAFYKEMWDTITRGSAWHGKVIDRKKDGSFFPAMLTISPIHAEPGHGSHYSHFVGIQSDLTEIEDLEQQFQQAQKMEAIGTLVGGIAHDFNNMLAGMNGNLYLARKSVQAMPDVVQKLANVEQIAFRASDMIQQLLTFARKDRVSIKPLPFVQFTKETFKLLRPSVPENIAMRMDVCCEMLQVNGDGTQLHQVLMNLVNNASDAVKEADDPCITVRLESFHADKRFIKSRAAHVKPGVFAHLSVADNGHGIPEDQIKHLFEPFFTTKEQGKGTGLGLAMVFGAVKTHQGFLEVDSVEGEGSVFHIYLPLLEPEDIDAASVQMEAEVAEQGHGEVILLVDDETCIVDTGAEVLKALGYQVLKARNGQQAVEIFTAHRDEIALIILDVVMPIMGGGKAAELIRQQRPDVKIIFSTGYDKNTQTELSHETVLDKPFSIAIMSRMIRQQLGG